MCWRRDVKAYYVLDKRLKRIVLAKSIGIFRIIASMTNGAVLVAKLRRSVKPVKIDRQLRYRSFLRGPCR